MGYRDDFYIVANIVGYTGDVAVYPTVYFQIGDEYGRITQRHDAPTNLGRNKVYKDATYTFENRTQPDGSVCMVEMSKGKVRHTSRNSFIPRTGLSAEQVALLAQSIINYQLEKTIEIADRKVRAAEDAKYALNEHFRAVVRGRRGRA